LRGFRRDSIGLSRSSKIVAIEHESPVIFIDTDEQAEGLAGAEQCFGFSDRSRMNGVGGLYAFDFTPGNAGYGNTPHGAMAFVRIAAE
jgi:hypothetical protein